MSISIEAQLLRDEATAQLQALLARMADRRTFFSSVGDTLIRSASDNFRKEGGPDGKPWTKLKPATIRARKKNNQTPITILRANTKPGSSLAGSVVRRFDNEELRVGSDLPYAAIHQLGGVIEKAAGSRWMAGRRFAKRDKHPEGAEKAIKAHRIKIPARPYLGVSAADEAQILADAEDWLAP